MPKNARICGSERAVRTAAQLLLLILPMGVNARAADKVMTIAGLQITVDASTGGIRSLVYPGVGELLSSSNDSAGLINVGYPVAAFAALQLEPRYSRAQIEKEADGLTILWKPLGASRPHLLPPGAEVLAEVRITAAPDGKSIALKARVQNASEASVRQILFPDLPGLQAIDEPERMELRMALGTVNPLAGPVRPPDRALFYAPLMWRQYPSEGQYHMNALRWMDFGCLKGGISLHERRWLEEPRAALLTRRSESNPDVLRIAWQHKMELRPGESWESAEFWLTPHFGGWAKGIEPFRDYVASVNPERPHPEQIRHSLGMQTVWMIQTSEPDPAKADFKFKDLVDVARDAQDHGLDTVVLWGWCAYGHLPMRHRSELGSESELFQAIREARSFGVTIAPFINVKNLDDYLAERYGVEPGTSAAWKYHPEMIPAMAPFFSEEPSGQIDIETTNERWQQDVTATLVEWARRGATSFCWDVFQDYGSMALIDFISRTRAEIGSLDPQATFGAEPYMGSFERATQVLDYTWNWVDYLEAAPYMNVLRWPRINCNIEGSPRIVKMAFADGLFINAMPKWDDRPNGTKMIRDAAELSAALREVAALRRRYLRYFTEGIPLGDSVLFEPVCSFIRSYKESEIGGATFKPPLFEYPPVFVRGYQLNDRLLIIVLNNADEPADIAISSNLTLWLPPAEKFEIAINENGEKQQGIFHLETRDGRRMWNAAPVRVGAGKMVFYEISVALD